MAISQYLAESVDVNKLKFDLKKVESSLDSALTANISMTGDNATLKDKISKLEEIAKGLENWALTAKKSMRKSAKEIEGLRVNKDVCNGALVVIDDIPVYVPPSNAQSSTPIGETR